MPLVELHDLEKSYGSVKALENLTLEIPQGSFFGLLGPNGSGKSTTLRILCTLLEPDSGEVTVAGENALKNSRNVRSKIGYVAQEVEIEKINRNIGTQQMRIEKIEAEKNRNVWRQNTTREKAVNQK